MNPEMILTVVKIIMFSIAVTFAVNIPWFKYAMKKDYSPSLAVVIFFMFAAIEATLITYFIVR